MNVVVVDIETTGLDVDTVDIHCIVAQHPGRKAVWFGPKDIKKGIAFLNNVIAQGTVLSGHNIINYDIPILRRYRMNDPGPCLDTLMMSRAAYPGSSLLLKDREFLKKHPDLEKELRPGAHSLKAWGLRLGHPKDDYDGGWEEFSEEMLRYCVQDVATNVELLSLLRTRIPDDAALLECEVARICRGMHLHGASFDVKAAEALTIRLAQRREILERELKETFGTWYEPGQVKDPKRAAQSRKVSPGEPGYRNVSPGSPYQDVKLTEFNPASTDHIARCLMTKYRWSPTKYTPGGKPQVTAEVLHDLTYPEAPALAEYQEIKKILGYLAEGNNAWMKLERNGRLHGKINPTGTVSGRASHNSPNTGNVPSRSDLGLECRRLFTPSTGRVLVGADASGLQLRILAHYLAKWDGGSFARQCEDGDIHEYMREATGLYTRNFQKTWTYAKLFGAGPGKLGQTAILDHRAALASGLTEEPVPDQRKAGALGKRTLANLGDAIPAFTELERDLAAAAKKGKLTTLDGRNIPVGSEHLAIAMLLQGGEAVVMKHAMVLAEASLKLLCAKYVLWVHDEFQVESLPEVAEHVGLTLVTAMNQAGEDLGLRVRIDGDYKIGNNWAETH